jgi:hypothetical protein
MYLVGKLKVILRDFLTSVKRNIIQDKGIHFPAKLNNVQGNMSKQLKLRYNISCLAPKTPLDEPFDIANLNTFKS